MFFWLWSSMHKNGYCRKTFFLNKSCGGLVLGVLRSIMCMMYKFVHISCFSYQASFDLIMT